MGRKTIAQPAASISTQSPILLAALRRGQGPIPASGPTGFRAMLGAALRCDPQPSTSVRARAMPTSAFPKFESYATHGTPAFVVQRPVQFQGIAVLVLMPQPSGSRRLRSRAHDPSQAVETLRDSALERSRVWPRELA